MEWNSSHGREADAGAGGFPLRHLAGNRWCCCGDDLLLLPPPLLIGSPRGGALLVQARAFGSSGHRRGSTAPGGGITALYSGVRLKRAARTTAGSAIRRHHKIRFDVASCWTSEGADADRYAFVTLALLTMLHLPGRRFPSAACIKWKQLLSASRWIILTKNDDSRRPWLD